MDSGVTTMEPKLVETIPDLVDLCKKEGILLFNQTTNEFYVLGEVKHGDKEYVHLASATARRNPFLRGAPTDGIFPGASSIWLAKSLIGCSYYCPSDAFESKSKWEAR